MHRLFWKFFLSFWVALVLFAGATLLAASHYLDQFREQDQAAKPFGRMTREVAEAQMAAQRNGIDGLKKWARKADNQDLIPILVLDGNGADLLGREVQQGVLSHLSRHIKRAQQARDGALPAVVYLNDHTQFWLMPDFHNVTLGRLLSRPRVLAMPLILAALVGGLACFLLVRYLTAPVEQLRCATEAYAEGDLSHRVAPLLGGRRDEIADLAFAFDRMAERLSSLMLSHKQLLRDVSHELRSPLARLQAALGLARRRAGKEAGPELDRIEREAERLNDLIGQLLALARLESGAQTPPMEPVDLQELLETVASDAALEARARQCAVVLEHGERIVIQGNPALLHSALENVMRNAVRYTAQGSAITLSSRRDQDRPDQWLIEISDRGPGVPEEMLPHLFEPFVRVGDARDRTTGGYGLGLSIAERAIRSHRGTILARNRREGGLTVTIQLPVAAAADGRGKSDGG